MATEKSDSVKNLIQTHNAPAYSAVKFTNICIDGIDKSGKNIVAEYIKQLSNHKYTVFDRGVISEITYSRLFGRNQTFDIAPYKRFVFINLLVDEEDWKIRCKMTNEPKIDYVKNVEAFNETISQFKQNEYIVLKFNTSQLTPYAIAKAVIKFMEEMNQPNENAYAFSE